MFENIITEISSTPLLIRESALQSVEFLLHRKLNVEKTEQFLLPHQSYKNAVVPSQAYEGNPFDSFEKNSIAFIPIVGAMFKYGYDEYGEYIPGMDDIANLIRYADESENIIGTYLIFNTPGGTTQSLIQMEDALRNRTKPSLAFIDGMCCSAGIYVASFCDKIIAAHRMCEIGSIGVQITLYDFKQMYEQMGIKQITIRPDESKYKNTEYDEAVNGNDSRLKTSNLAPFAIHFQNTIKSNRPNLDISVEGVLEGKVFYAYDALKNGLLDDILNFNESIRVLQSLYTENQSIYSQFK